EGKGKKKSKNGRREGKKKKTKDRSGNLESGVCSLESAELSRRVVVREGEKKGKIGRIRYGVQDGADAETP
ncbi:hypothetical protein M747DRAFT_293220, partial [Aspergillus niger ATCC 13496]